MSYSKQMFDLRNDMHRSIIHMSIRAAGAGDLQVLLDNPISVKYCDRDVVYHVTLTGVNCINGELIAENSAGSRRRIYYNDLTLEQLALLHDNIEANLFTLNLQEV